MNTGIYGYPKPPVDPLPWERPFPDIPTWIAPVGQGNANHNNASGVLYLNVIKLFRPIVVSGLACRLQATPAASLDAYVCVYSDEDFQPAERLAMATFTGLTTNGVKSADIPDTVLFPGLYWTGVLHVSSTAAAQAFETRIIGGDIHPRSQWYTVNHHGTSAGGPALSGANDATAWQQTVAVPPQRFGGTRRSDANNPSGSVWVEMKVRAW